MRRRLDKDFQQELDSHLALLVEENIRRGTLRDSTGGSYMKKRRRCHPRLAMAG
jgi:hypothetical protein